jgi:HEAT repeat protein
MIRPLAAAGTATLALFLSASVSAQESKTTAATVTALGNFDLAIRTEAAKRLRRTPALDAVPLLSQASRTHADGYVRYRALVILAGFGDAAAPVMRELIADRDDRIRSVTYGWFEHHPTSDVIPVLIEALKRERSEFVRSALTRALATAGSDARVREALAPLVVSGDDSVRGAVIAALGDYRRTFALPEMSGVATLEGPLQDDAITALGQIGDKSSVGLLRTLREKGRPEIQPAVSAAFCLLDTGCADEWQFLRSSWPAALARRDEDPFIRALTHAYGVLARFGHDEALSLLIDLGINESDRVRTAIALSLGTVALRTPQRVLRVAAKRSDLEAVAALLRDAFDMLSEDLEEEAFFVELRAAYWAAPDDSPVRHAAALLMNRLEFS